VADGRNISIDKADNPLNMYQLYRDGQPFRHPHGKTSKMRAISDLNYLLAS